MGIATPTFKARHDFSLYRITRAPFRTLFARSAAKLAARAMRRVVAPPGDTLPCRVALADAAPEDRMNLLAHAHQPAALPDRVADGAAYIRVYNARRGGVCSRVERG